MWTAIGRAGLVSRDRPGNLRLVKPRRYSENPRNQNHPSLANPQHFPADLARERLSGSDFPGQWPISNMRLHLPPGINVYFKHRGFQKASLLQPRRSIGTASMVLGDVITVLRKAVPVDLGIRPGSRSVIGGNISAAGSGCQLPPADSLKQAVDVAYGDVSTGDPRNLILHLPSSGDVASLRVPFEALQQGLLLVQGQISPATSAPTLPLQTIWPQAVVLAHP